MKKIVIFDMDGTLIDSKKDITTSINYVRDKNHSLGPLDETFVVEAINMHERNLPKLFYNTDNYEDRDRVVFEEHYKIQCTKHTYLYDGVKELLDELLKNGVELAVATNAPTKFAKLMLDNLGVLDKFGIVIGADKVNIPKPNPQMINDILEYYDFNKNEDKAWMVGDNTKDIESALNAGIGAIFATWGFSSFGEYIVVAKNPSEILEYVLH